MNLKIREKNNFLDISNEFSSFENSSIVILQAGYEHSVSWGKNTLAGPEDIINSSAYVEFFDDEFERELCFDKGIATFENIEFNNKTPQEVINDIEESVTECLNYDKFVVTLGGEHTISIAPILAHYKKYPNISLLQFDAHSDLRQSYQNSKYSHASVMARVCEFFPNDRITQVGIRALCQEEYEFIKKNNIKTFFASSIRRGIYGKNWQKKIVETLNDKIYITFDVDYFDPSMMPSTGTPEPDGFFYNETLEIFREIIKAKKEIVGFDVVEYAPIENLHHAGMTVARLIYKILNFAFYKR